jgi:hypothetical protein
MKKGQLNVNELIEILKRDFDGDEPVWYRVIDDPSRCYSELWEKDVRRGGVCVSCEDDDEKTGQCILGDLPV